MSITPRRLVLVLVLAFTVIACGGGGSGGSGSGGDEGGDGEQRSLLIRWGATSNAVGYVIHWGPAPATYTRALDVGRAETAENGVVSFLLDDVGAAGTIHFALTSYDDAGNMSAFSNEIVVDIP